MNDPATHLVPDNVPPQRRFGFWSNLGGGALSFAILFHLAVLTIGAIWIFQVTRPPVKDVPITGGKTGGGPATTQPKALPARPTQITPSSVLNRIAAQDVESALTLPDAGDGFGAKTALDALPGGGLTGALGGPGRGSSRGPGDAFIQSVGPNKRFFLPEDPFAKRCSKADRLQRIKDNGGTPACEEAVLKGLRWLKANQNPDGSWTGHQAAMTGLALLAYSGHCETPFSEEFGDSCLKGIAYLVDLGLKNHGRLTTNPSANSWPYEHAIATYALAEALAFCKETKFEVPNLIGVTAAAGQLIIDHQHDKGGWAYLYATTAGHADVSVAGWQIQALKACSHSGLKLRGLQPCINKALDYLASCQNESGGFGYMGPGDGQRNGYFTLTGVGVLCHQMWGKGGKAEVRKGLKYLTKNTRFDYTGECCDLYGHYYESQAMMHQGGEDWKKYNDLFRDQLLNNQDSDGSWKVPGGGKTIRAAGSEYVGDKVYRTCLCTLMLEVYYRFLNTSGGNAKERSGI